MTDRNEYPDAAPIGPSRVQFAAFAAALLFAAIDLCAPAVVHGSDAHSRRTESGVSQQTLSAGIQPRLTAQTPVRGTAGSSSDGSELTPGSSSLSATNAGVGHASGGSGGGEFGKGSDDDQAPRASVHGALAEILMKLGASA